MTRPWIEPPSLETPPELTALVGGFPLLGQALARRGYPSAAAAQAFLDPARYHPAPAGDLPGLAAVVDRLERAIRTRQLIWVWGDFDVDGQTATTVLVSILRDLGARVQYTIPVRASHSHGVHLDGLSHAIAAGAQVVLTCDTGIAASEAAAYARAQGVDFLVSDHHELPPVLPDAYALTNPRLLPAGHPLETLPGVGVAYKLAEELAGRFHCPERAEGLLDLAALGIVADVAVQTGDTRWMLQRGLQSLRSTRRLALQALFDFAGLDPLNLTEEHLGFALGPRLNALGRLGDANPAVEFFLTRDLGRARVFAQELEGLNAERQLLTNQTFKAALAALESEPALGRGPALVLGRPGWPAGIIGIVASRLVERSGKPVVLIALPDGGSAAEPGRGSARSVPGVNITAAIAAVQQAHPDWVLGFGGHPMAAGLALAPGRLDDFRRALWQALLERSQAGGAPPEPSLALDGALPLAAATLEFAEALERLAPFGPGNPPLTFLGPRLTVRRDAAVGRESEHRLVTVEDEHGQARKVVWWNGAGLPLPEGRFDLAYRLRASSYQGRREAQVEWVDFRPLEEPVIQLQTPALRLNDYRAEPDPERRLKQLAEAGPLQIWCEGQAAAGLTQCGFIPAGLSGLAPGPHLVIWTAPPGLAELQAACERVDPQAVSLFCLDSGPGDPQAFLQRLAGLAKYALAHLAGRADLDALARATGQSRLAVRLGHEWLAAKGYLRVSQADGSLLMLEPGSPAGEPSAGPAPLLADLRLVLEETAAFRRTLLTAPAEQVRLLLHKPG